MEKREIRCPKCGREEGQHKKGTTNSGTQRMFCNSCKYKYTPNPKSRAYGEDVREEALRLLDSGVTGRGVGKIMKMSKSNAYRWAREDENKRNSNDKSFEES